MKNKLSVRALALLAALLLAALTGCEPDGNTLEARDKFIEDLYGSVALQIADSTTESALAKLFHLLGIHSDNGRVEALFGTDLKGEITK